MWNRARNRVVLFPESHSLGIIPKKLKTIFFALILRLTHDLSGLENLKFATLCLEIPDLPIVCLSCFLDQFISTLSAGNHSVKFQDINISTENSPCKLFWDYSNHRTLETQPQSKILVLTNRHSERPRKKCISGPQSSNVFLPCLSSETESKLSLYNWSWFMMISQLLIHSLTLFFYLAVFHLVCTRTRRRVHMTHKAQWINTNLGRLHIVFDLVGLAVRCGCVFPGHLVHMV